MFWQVREVKRLEENRERERKGESCRVDETQRKEVKMRLHVERRKIALSSERVRVKGNQLACLHAIRKTSVYMFGIKLCWNFPVHTHQKSSQCHPYMEKCSN